MERCIRVGIDVGSESHTVAIASPEGEFLDEFAISHSREGFDEFFARVESKSNGTPVTVAMEGYGGHARPLDGLIMERGYKLLNVNNLKLARFREVFPAPSRTDDRDARLIVSLMQMDEHLPAEKDALARVLKVPEVNAKLKRLTRRRADLVSERVRATNRMHSDLMAVCPELLGITGSHENRWFLGLLTSRDDLTKLARMRPESILAIRGIGKTYLKAVLAWQRKASFSAEVGWVGSMIVSDARRTLELTHQIAELERAIEKLSEESEIARRLLTIQGFGKVGAATLAGEIGTLDRFKSEKSLALYLGMCPLKVTIQPNRLPTPTGS